MHEYCAFHESGPMFHGLANNKNTKCPRIVERGEKRLKGQVLPPGPGWLCGSRSRGLLAWLANMITLRMGESDARYRA